MSPDDLGADGANDGPGPSSPAGRDEFGWLRMPSRSGLDPVCAISRADATRISGESQ